MTCPTCQTDNDRVIDSRDCDNGRAIRRRRRCQDCGHRWTTFEYAAGVVKSKLTNEQIASAQALAKRLLAAADALYQGLTKE